MKKSRVWARSNGSCAGPPHHVLAATFRRQGDPVAAMQQLKKDNLALQQERDWILQAEGWSLTI